MMRDKTPIPTQMLDLRSVDFGPSQESPGGRIRSLGAPPPTGMIRPDLLLRNDREIMAQLKAERRSASHIAHTAKVRFFKRSKAVLHALLDRLPPLMNRLMLLLLGVRDTATESWASFVGWLAEKRGRTLGRVRTVNASTALRVRCARDGRLSVHVDEGARLLVYPEHGARVGWRLARTVDGDVGFIETQFLG